MDSRTSKIPLSSPRNELTPLPSQNPGKAWCWKYVEKSGHLPDKTEFAFLISFASVNITVMTLASSSVVQLTKTPFEGPEAKDSDLQMQHQS